MAKAAVVYACAECGYSALNGGTHGSPVGPLLHAYKGIDVTWAFAEQSSASPSICLARESRQEA